MTHGKQGMTEPDFARLHAWVDGHVQGVGFRAFVYEIALSQDLTGWVRNTQKVWLRCWEKGRVKTWISCWLISRAGRAARL